MENTNEKIDKTSLKFNQGSIVVLSGLAYLFNIYWLVAFVGVVLLLDTLIPGAGLFKLFYKHIVKPLNILNPNISNESRAPHQFAQGLGGSFLLLSFILLLYFNSAFFGWTLSFIVIALAFVNLTLDFCAGCFIYFQIQKIKLSASLTENKNA
ncbi:MAG: DUF4395 domain-containing protein [Ignavibacteriaceae bacterium]|jgi:hypothetical protein